MTRFQEYVKGSVVGFAGGVSVRPERQEDSSLHKNYWKNSRRKGERR